MGILWPSLQDSCLPLMWLTKIQLVRIPILGNTSWSKNLAFQKPRSLYSFNKYILSTYFVPRLGIGDMAMNRTEKIPVPVEILF